MGLIVGSITQYPHNERKESHDIDGVPDDIMDLVFRTGKTIDLPRSCKIVGNVWGDLFQSGEMGMYRDKVFDLYDKGELKALIDDRNEVHGVNSTCDAVDYMLSRKSVGKVTVTISK